MSRFGYINLNVKREIMIVALSLLLMHREGFSDEHVDRMLEKLKEFFKELYGFNEPNTMLTFFDEIVMWKDTIDFAVQNVNQCNPNAFSQTVASTRCVSEIVQSLEDLNNEYSEITSVSVDARGFFIVLYSNLQMMGEL